VAGDDSRKHGREEREGEGPGGRREEEEAIEVGGITEEGGDDIRRRCLGKDQRRRAIATKRNNTWQRKRERKGVNRHHLISAHICMCMPQVYRISLKYTGV
jgi:hypothetical protein